MAYTSFKQTSPERISLPPIIIMHGLLGSKQNWKTLGKLISDKTGRTVYTVDARNHGESSHTNEFNYYILGEDILYFLEEHSIPKACLMGHSMGGRAVMTVALHNPSVIEKLFVLDISPVGTAEAISSTPIFIETMRGVTIPDNLELHEARKMVDKLLLPIISEAGIRMFLLQNLVKKEKGFTWRANLDAIAKNFTDNIAGFPPAKDGKPFHGETYFIGGALSDYLKPSDHDEIKLLFPSAKFSYIEGAGHWLHAEKPKEFLQEVTTLLH
ncbi:Protein ABHD11 [Armadillidium nasatum]|uniref:sn-1-specific diacylglycerol lipase ABHD11 n=1 Tax=Armadillidium nasatum TaxID=96803 RepID=A0A5N5SUJ3_9CRUS|nr:Protein ABHD11 [Armadillidium nasatum]